MDAIRLCVDSNSPFDQPPRDFDSVLDLPLDMIHSVFDLNRDSESPDPLPNQLSLYTLASPQTSDKLPCCLMRFIRVTTRELLHAWSVLPATLIIISGDQRSLSKLLVRIAYASPFSRHLRNTFMFIGLLILVNFLPSYIFFSIFQHTHPFCLLVQKVLIADTAIFRNISEKLRISPYLVCWI